jgi:hypothetical protein
VYVVGTEYVTVVVPAGATAVAVVDEVSRLSLVDVCVVVVVIGRVSVSVTVLTAVVPTVPAVFVTVCVLTAVEVTMVV